MGDRRSTRATAPALWLVKPLAVSRAPVPPRHARSSSEPSPDVAFEQMERLLASGDFDATPRSRAFLRFIVEETLAGRQDGLTQAAVATRVFDRREDFDPTIDPIVRIQAGRLRRSLERYYLLAGAGDPVRIELPRGGYVPVVRWASRREGEAVPAAAAARGADDWPSVVVGPFRNGGMDARADEAAVRFCERVSVEIGRYGDVRVALWSELERLGGVACDRGGFLLSGHLTSDAAGWRALARLVDCRNARQIWAEEFRGGPGPASEFHDQAARMIAVRIASEHGVMARLLGAEQRRPAAGESTPYGAILRSYRFYSTREPDDLVAALAALQRVVRAEPECGAAWVQLARLCADNLALALAPVETPLELAMSCARNGVQLEPFSQRARTTLAQSLLLQGELAAARVEARQALELDPGALAGVDSIGWLLTLLGERRTGPALVREAIARNPCPSPVVFQALWLDHLQRGDFGESYRAALRYREPSSFWPALMRACSLGHLGRRAEAKPEAAEVLRRRPDFLRHGRALIGRLVRVPEAFDRLLSGLGRVGLGLE
ncbi:MAG TPA: hypothetical protein VMX54_01900 [Vicinamibacteria bacterium]|nr:hypothetical protein [Vicinamibacteria bacterium]